MIYLNLGKNNRYFNYVIMIFFDIDILFVCEGGREMGGGKGRGKEGKSILEMYNLLKNVFICYCELCYIY